MFCLRYWNLNMIAVFRVVSRELSVFCLRAVLLITMRKSVKSIVTLTLYTVAELQMWQFCS